MKPRLNPTTIAAYCQRRLAPYFSRSEVMAIERYLLDLLATRSFPPYRGQWIDHSLLADGTGVKAQAIRTNRNHLQPIFDALCRALASEERVPAVPLRSPSSPSTPPVGRASREKPKQKRGRKPRPILDRPPALWEAEVPDGTFAESLRREIERHGETMYHLSRAIEASGLPCNPKTLSDWCSASASPRTIGSLRTVAFIERRYGLPDGALKVLLPKQNAAPRGHLLADITPSERRRLVWHLPDDFASRPAAEQAEILEWVRTVVISGSTDYRRYQAAATQQRYAVRFRHIDGSRRRPGSRALPSGDGGVVDAPPRLQKEMDDLLRFKTSTLTAYGFQRNGVWNAETADQKIEHLGLMFGALVSSPDSEVQGFGADLATLSFGHLVFPAVWDWYLQWRERRRGFYTRWEVDMLAIVLAMVRADTGWLRQNPRLALHLAPIPGMVSEDDVERARGDWAAACDAMYRHGRNRIKEIDRVARIHRDPFEPILPILEADSPVGEYRKITEEILRLMPDERLYPKSAAEAVRSFLLLRFGLHLGLRQKNLRELLLCPRDRVPTSERALEDARRGEIRWSIREAGWEVLIPAIAFKNATSTFFADKPFRLVLPDIGGLYPMIDAYVSRHRARLLGPARDPGTFFVKTAKRPSADAAYNQTTFYEAWRLTVQRYGIYNPYTGRGAIPGLLPHGPHNVRDVLATHILKQTGSYEQASYAIQDTPEMVAQHYGRFLPQDKATIAARILNKVWEAA
ncbi:hypothetical protein E3C22_19500 [Jiella endophytica]|uniref:Uncharacterized protein n=2 Tax=Jiella endophytica TaxID=2558362 RepID=A0A4Y8RDP5_9HYPH|nr:hypothetical protein E3C22_19500 [Jiella endophytica]